MEQQTAGSPHPRFWVLTRAAGACVPGIRLHLLSKSENDERMVLPWMPPDRVRRRRVSQEGEAKGWRLEGPYGHIAATRAEGTRQRCILGPTEISRVQRTLPLPCT